MSRRSPAALLQDIVEAIRRIRLYTTHMDYDGFVQDTKTQDAVIRNIEIIGEAAKYIPEPLKEEHPSIPWKQITGTRDRLIHDYFGANLDIVWQIVDDELSPLLEGIQKALQKISN